MNPVKKTKKTIAIIGTLDTKGEEFAFLKNEIEKCGCNTLVINAGILKKPAFAPDIDADAVAGAAGETLSELAGRGDRGYALGVMSKGIAATLKRLHDEKKFDGVISMGGGGGTALGCAAMRGLPVGVPKLMVSTVASADTSPHIGAADIAMMPSVVDVAGLNQISRKIFSNAAGAICGMVENPGNEGETEEKPLVAATMFGNTTKAVNAAREIMEEASYEVLTFSATGIGGKTMESLVEQGYFRGVLDITTTEIADELCGGVHSAGPGRLEAAGRAGIPQVVTPACLDMCNFFGRGTVPEKYGGRLFYNWNPNVTLMRTTPEENAKMGEIFAQKLNKTKGPVAVFVPMGGFSEVDAPGKPFWWPEADAAFADALKSKLRPDISLVVSDCNVNDPQFAEILAHAFLDMLV